MHVTSLALSPTVIVIQLSVVWWRTKELFDATIVNPSIDEGVCAQVLSLISPPRRLEAVRLKWREKERASE